MRLGTPITIKRDVFCHLPYSDSVAPRTGGERVGIRTQNGTTSTADRAFWVKSRFRRSAGRGIGHHSS